MQRQIFWRSKDGKSAPPNAHFSIRTFGNQRLPLANFSVLPELPSPAPPAKVLRRTHNPDRATWIKLVKQALLQIEEGALQKVVLARETTLYLDKAPNPFQMAAALGPRSEGAALFCVQLNENRAFFGATPERLFQRGDQKIVVEAVAGTRKRGKTELESVQLAKELLSSEKDIREFQFVQAYFRKLLPHIEFSPVSVHRTANVQHLFSQGVSLLKPHQSHLDLIELLHPTPALAGTPKQTALEWINANEPFKRGLYGGIIGWENEAESEWMVAIRCCLLEGSIAKIYTGTGIVTGSDPSLEWEELEAKIALYDQLFCEAQE
jgi:menaquinone-specific isochorismate synthase